MTSAKSSRVYVSQPVSLSKAGLALILLENELQNNDAEVNRLTERLREAEMLLNAAIARRQENLNKLSRIVRGVQYSY